MRFPPSFPVRDFPEAGGLMSYGTSVTEAFRQMGVPTAAASSRVPWLQILAATVRERPKPASSKSLFVAYESGSGP
jgi:hypothetical protein